jgi:hypothetical protein
MQMKQNVIKLHLCASGDPQVTVHYNANRSTTSKIIHFGWKSSTADDLIHQYMADKIHLWKMIFNHRKRFKKHIFSAYDMNFSAKQNNNSYLLL